MKLASFIISLLALAGVITLFIFHGKEHGNMGKRTLVAAPAGPGRIAYVNIDTLESHYEYLKNKKSDFEKRQTAMEAELNRSYQQLQNEAAALQQKAQTGSLSQSEGEAAQRRLMQGQQSLETRKQSLTEQLLKERDDFNEEIHNRLDSFLAEYNKDKGYDYIFSYSATSPIMYADKRFDVTQDVIDGMNSISKNRSDTAKKK